MKKRVWIIFLILMLMLLGLNNLTYAKKLDKKEILDKLNISSDSKVVKDLKITLQSKKIIAANVFGDKKEEYILILNGLDKGGIVIYDSDFKVIDKKQFNYIEEVKILNTIKDNQQEIKLITKGNNPYGKLLKIKIIKVQDMSIRIIWDSLLKRKDIGTKIVTELIGNIKFEDYDRNETLEIYKMTISKKYTVGTQHPKIKKSLKRFVWNEKKYNYIEKAIDNKFAHSLINEAFDKICKFYISSLPCDREKKITKNNSTYYLVKKLNTKKDIKEYLGEYFTESIVEKIYNDVKNKFIENNNKVYQLGGEMGTLMLWHRADLKLISKSPYEEKYVYKVKVPYFDAYKEKTVEIKYVWEKGWRVNTFLDY